MGQDVSRDGPASGGEKEGSVEQTEGDVVAMERGCEEAVVAAGAIGRVGQTDEGRQHGSNVGATIRERIWG